MKASGDQYDERIVECSWDDELQSWKFMRFRDDKHDGNFIDIGDKIIYSIKDGVVQEQVSPSDLFQRAQCESDRVLFPRQLIERIPAIRAAHKERRAKAAATGARPPDQQRSAVPRAPTARPPAAPTSGYPGQGMPRPGGYPMPTARGYMSGAPGGGLRR